MKTRFDVIGKSYEKALQLCPEARTDADEVLKLAAIRKNEKVLEITSGSGFMSVKIARLLKNGKLTSQDISPQMTALAKEKVKKLKLRNIDFYVTGNMTFPELCDASFDKALCLGGFHHIEEPVKLFRTIHRVLRPKGTFIVGDFADNSPVQRYFDERIHRLTDTGHSGLFLTESQMRNFARFGKLKVLSIEKKQIPFIFKTEKDAAIFYKLVHALNQSEEEVLRDIKDYMGIYKTGKLVLVPMDYIFAKYEKE